MVFKTLVIFESLDGEAKKMFVLQLISRGEDGQHNLGNQEVDRVFIFKNSFVFSIYLSNFTFGVHF